MKTLRSKLAILLVASALIPLILFGFISLYNFQSSLKSSIEESYAEITRRVAEEIGLYLDHAEKLLETLSQDLKETGLSQEQAERIAENYVIRFSEFLKIIYYDEKLQPLFSTRLREGDAETPDQVFLEEVRQKQGFLFLEPYLSKELTPVAWFLVPMGKEEHFDGVMAAKVDLMQMWRWVSATRLGKEGYASVVNDQGQIIATGDPFYKKQLLGSVESVIHSAGNLEGLSRKPQIVRTSQGEYLVSQEKVRDEPSWYLLLSQPTSEAFSQVYNTRLALVALVLLTLLLMLSTAALGGRRVLLKPVSKLIKAIRALGKGQLDYRIQNLGTDEFGQLGESFNQMAGQLADLQERTRRQERSAMFGRMASGLAHDLKHPVASVQSAAKVLEERHQDPEYRATFSRVVKREFSRINQFLSDLRNLTHEMPFHPGVFDLKNLVKEIFESFHGQAQEVHGKLRLNTGLESLKLEADLKLLRRALENLISNALQALPAEGGWVEVELAALEKEVCIRVRDNGKGIPQERLPGLFDEYTTTKRKGLGLGLAITKKIIELHGGSIRVESGLGKGTIFELNFPRWQKVDSASSKSVRNG